MSHSAFCIKCWKFRKVVDIQPATVKVPPNIISWRWKCSYCGQGGVSHERTQVTSENSVEMLSDAIGMIETAISGELEFVNSGEPVESDDMANIPFWPFDIGFSPNHRPWHPREWDIILNALEQLTGIRAIDVQAAQLDEEPKEFRGEGPISLYGALDDTGKASYFLGKANFWV